MKNVFWIAILFFTTASFGQIIKTKIKEPPKKGGGFVRNNDTIFIKKDSLGKAIKTFPVDQYKRFNIQNDTIAIDTILDIRHYYSFNELFRDDFLDLKLHNYGQAVNKLAYQDKQEDLLPGFVACSKQTDDWTHSEIPFFKTPSPYSDLRFLNGVSQGQLLNSEFATNVSPQLNLAAGYRGLSSLGLYQRSIVNSGRFFGSLNYQSKNEKYLLKFYYYTYNKTSEENGGIRDSEQFENGGDTFKDRGRIEVNLKDTENTYKNKRLFTGQEYRLVKNKIGLTNDFLYHKKTYEFSQKSPSYLLGESSVSGIFKDSITLQKVENYTAVKFKTKIFNIKSGIRYIYQKYSMDSLKELNGVIYPKELKYNDLSLDNELKFKLKNIELTSKLNIAFTENIDGYYFETKAGYKFNKKINIKGQLKSISKRPDFKYILYQSAYDKFNWYHPDYKNELIQDLNLELKHNKWGSIKLNQLIINNYTFYGLDSLPHQSESGIKYSGLTYKNDFRYKKWGLSVDLQLQKVIDGEEIFPLPGYVARSSFYYSNYYYNRNLYVQTGVTAKIFEAFYAPAYNPLTADFVLQNRQKIGGYPWIDYFINFKIKRFRFYFKLEHLNALFEYQTPDYYAAPLQPTRDFSIRFGLRWIFLN